MDIKEITKGLNKYNTALVESAEKLGESSQKMIAQQLGEQKKDFSSFLAGRKLQKAIRNTDRTALEQAKKHLDDPTSKNQGSPAKTSLAAEILLHPHWPKIYFCLKKI